MSDETKPQGVKKEALTAFQIYSLYDARARDYRTIALGLIAAMVALTIAAGNAVVPCFAKQGDWLWSECPNRNLSLYYLLIAAVFGIIALAWPARQVKIVRRKSAHIWDQHITNKYLVPPIDENLSGKEVVQSKHGDTSRMEQGDVLIPIPEVK